MRKAVIACVIWALLAMASAVHVPTHRKLLTLSSADSSQVHKPHRSYDDQANAQLAANNAALVNTQYAINAAVESGAAPAVTQAATGYGADQAYLATQATKHCGGGYNKPYYPC